MSDRISYMRAEIAYYLSEIQRRLFVPGSKITILIRPPGGIEREVLVTDDDLDDVAAAIDRSKARETVSVP